jgi:cellulose synthase/poly-beta-1,6-N-acetylglucosamine synthase-like glycosyltransferase
VVVTWYAAAAVGAAAGATVLGIWLGYPALTFALARRRRTARHRGAEAPTVVPPAPRVTVVVATRDAPALVARRVANLRETTFPLERLAIVVAVDAGAAHPVDDYAALLGDAALVLPGDAPGGKAASLNAGVRGAPPGDVLLFADSAQSFDPDTIPRLVARLMDDPALGAVSGLIVQPNSGDGLMDRYWRFEVALRHAQEALHSIICVSGAVYVVRRALWRPMPAALICDDLFMTMHVAASGHRVVLEPEARAIDARVFTPEEHLARKLRTQVGLWQFLAWCPWALAPTRNPMWWHLIAHKVLRVLTPLLVLVGVLAVGTAVAVILGRQGVLTILGGLALLLTGARVLAPMAFRRYAAKAAWMLRLQAVPALAVLRALRRDWNVWRRAASADDAPTRLAATAPLAALGTRDVPSPASGG